MTLLPDPAPNPAAVVGPEAAGAGFVVREVEYAAGCRQAPHAHPTAGITLVVCGGLVETTGGREERASALSVVVKPVGVVHADAVGPRGARTLQVEIRDPALLPEGSASWRWHHAGPGLSPLLALLRALRAGRAPEDPVLEVLGELVDGGEDPRRDPPGWLRRAREALDDRATAGLTVRGLAAEVGVHPVSLTRAFRRQWGVTVSAYRRRVRLRVAARQIAGTDRPLGRVAHAAGYADQAHLCRDVRAATGWTPSEIRDLARA